MFSDINEKLKNKEITLAEWEAEVRKRLALLYLAALLLRAGGSQNTTAADYELMQNALLIQYGYLDGFARDIEKDPAIWLTARMDARISLYNQSSYAAFEGFNSDFANSLGFTEERRVLGVADHCSDKGKAGTPGCIELASLGWQPIGTLPKIGEALCRTNCKCNFIYRKPNGKGWIYG